MPVSPAGKGKNPGNLCHYGKAFSALEAEIESETRKAEAILDRAQGVADEEDYEIETDLVQAREAGPSIIDEAVDHNVDLILMGIKYKRAFGQFNLGSVVPYILENAPCRVILYHQYRAPPVSGQI